jgi:hypothetical protein
MMESNENDTMTSMSNTTTSTEKTKKTATAAGRRSWRSHSASPPCFRNSCGAREYQLLLPPRGPLRRQDEIGDCERDDDTNAVRARIRAHRDHYVAIMIARVRNASVLNYMYSLRFF